MEDFDLWSDDEFLFPKKAEKEIIPEKEPIPSHIIEKLKEKIAFIEIEDNNIVVYSKKDLREEAEDFKSVLGLKTEFYSDEAIWVYKARFGPINSYVMRYALGKIKPGFTKETASLLGASADKINRPFAKLSDDKKYIEVYCPAIDPYQKILKAVNAYPKQGYYRVQTVRVLDFESLVANNKSKLPSILIGKEVLALSRDRIVGFDGTLDSLKDIPVDSLNVIASKVQSRKDVKRSSKTVSEKMESLGIKNLHDLLFWTPKRYIDKSKPHDIKDLIEGESATIVGVITSSGTLPGQIGGVSFNVKDNTGQSIRVAFWRQAWLKNKFHIGSEVLITGKFSWWNRQPQLNGSSIDFAEEAAILPIVPVYRQSESKGITTTLILSAIRELLSRINGIKLPVYLRKQGHMDYTEALTELHFPTSLERHHEALEMLAYYELIYMQIIVQEQKEINSKNRGVSIKNQNSELQKQAIETLPFELTNSQNEALKTINKNLANDTPSTILVNSDVGTGKTVIAQLSILKAFEAGYQSVFTAPTDILARQLYSTFVKLINELPGKKPNIVFLQGRMKAAEKREIIKKIGTGEIDIIIGTHSVFSAKVKYHNLGLFCIDEQQKFGAEQRSSLLTARNDNLIPNLIMLTATPIPRSTAQVIYGEIEMLMLTDKPAGRLPIETVWVKENPVEITSNFASPLWDDIKNEAKKGNQTFVITPLVNESDKIDAASVESTFKNLKDITLSELKIGFVHGQMSQESQQEFMNAFRRKEYDVLVASTVVEVGVDIPDATRVVILNADRLGASSLHQIRGRVGRNDKQSKCFLVSSNENENSAFRLQSLVDNENGFDIAKADLSLRGEGTMFSVSQSGKTEMIFARLSKHKELIDDARQEAIRILNSPFRETALKDSKIKFETDERLV